MVYGIIELINFAHGDVFMVGAFMSLYVARPTSSAQDGPIDEPAAAGGRPLRRLRSRPCRCWASSASPSSGSPIARCGTRPALAPLITAIGVSFILQNIIQILVRPVADQHAPQIFPPTGARRHPRSSRSAS